MRARKPSASTGAGAGAVEPRATWAGPRRVTEAPGGFPPALLRPFRLIAFDWDGTAVVDRRADATAVRTVIDRLLRQGVLIAVITGTKFENVDRQLSSGIHGPHKQRLFILTNRGSEVWGFDAAGRRVLLHRRVATPEEERRLTAAADAVRAALVARTGLDIRVIYDRLNRRKIDLIPLAEWADPPKSEIGALYRAVQSRLVNAGYTGGLAEAFRLARETAARHGLQDPRITSDVKHIEIGLTDKSDSVDWLMRELAPKHGITPEEVLIGGDEFGDVAGFEGSDARMLTPSARGATFVSVGPEPGGAPPEVIHLGGGPERFVQLLEAQAQLHERRAADGDDIADTAESAPGTPPPHTPERIAFALPTTPTPDPRWRIVEEGLNIAREHEIESIFAISNGYLGTRGSLAEASSFSTPATLIAGVYDVEEHSPDIPELVVMPDWMRLCAFVDGQPFEAGRGEILEHRRILDMRQGLFWREWRHRDPEGRIFRLRALRLASLADRHALVQSVVFTPENFAGRIALETRIEPPPRHEMLPGVRAVRVRPEAPRNRATAPMALALRTPTTGTTVAFASTATLRPEGSARSVQEHPGDDGRLIQRIPVEVEIGGVYRLDRYVSVFTSRDTDRPDEAAARHLATLRRRGADALIADHVATWRDRWRAADVEIDGDDDAQRAIRFACYHLIAAANPEDERVSVPARALTGPSYSGHVFWDTEIYMLPFYIHTHPETARALLLYRWHTLPAAREKARAHGYRGAFYAWESAADGAEATPRRVLAPDGQIVTIRTGDLETHISADVAYGVWRYWRSTGDHAFILDAGAEILLETARFWASRGRFEDDGHFHIRNVIGPDEYHEDVDDNAYTNGMAAWNLECAAHTAALLARRWPDRWKELRRRTGLEPHEPAEWRRMAGAIYLPIDPRTGLIEQFQGFFDLEEIDLAEFEPRTAPIDVILGRERTRRSQVLKQPDVLMLIALLWDRFPARVREANFRYYDPRTAHGSSLSPSIHALLAARLGDLAAAERYFRQAAEIDLADNMGNAAGGVHAAALGGLWQAVVFGFAGARFSGSRPSFEPRLPAGWRALRFRVRWRGVTYRVAIEAGGAVSCEPEPEDRTE
jgi:trehalose/maltose hydrolase-like predicted phosphorylase